MSELVVAAYNREDAAAHVLAFLRAHTDELSLDLNSAAIVRVEDSGRYSVTTTAGPGGAGSAWSVLWSALFDLVFLVPELLLLIVAIQSTAGAVAQKPAGSVA